MYPLCKYSEHDWLRTAGSVQRVTMRKHDGLADREIVDLVALLDSLSFSLKLLNLSFSGTSFTHTVLGLYTWSAFSLGLGCRPFRLQL